jgi:hypothetical protein
MIICSVLWVACDNLIEDSEKKSAKTDPSQPNETQCSEPKLEDGCNSCVCEEGGWSCTEMACEEPDDPEPEANVCQFKPDEDRKIESDAFNCSVMAVEEPNWKNPCEGWGEKQNGLTCSAAPPYSYFYRCKIKDKSSAGPYKLTFENLELDLQNVTFFDKSGALTDTEIAANKQVLDLPKQSPVLANDRFNFILDSGGVVDACAKQGINIPGCLYEKKEVDCNCNGCNKLCYEYTCGESELSHL